jgi:hypothetical protein
MRHRPKPALNATKAAATASGAYCRLRAWYIATLAVMTRALMRKTPPSSAIWARAAKGSWECPSRAQGNPENTAYDRNSSRAVQIPGRTRSASLLSENLEAAQAKAPKYSARYAMRRRSRVMAMGMPMPP